MEKVIRLSPKKETLRALFAKSGNKCAFPGCDHVLIDEDNEFVAQVCHIEAAEEGGERFNSNQSNEDRRSYDNLVLLCYPHHVKTNDVEKYPVGKLKEIKVNHESTDAHFEIRDSAIDSIFNDLLTSIQHVKATTDVILTHSVKADADLVVIKAQLEKLTSQNQVQSDFPELQNIRDLRNSDKHTASLLIISELKKSKWLKLSNDNKSRVTINEALCELALNNSVRAANLFIEALEWNQNDEHYLSYAAYGYSILGKKEEATKYLLRSLEINPNNVNAYVALIQINKDTDYEELIVQIPSEIQEVPEICYNLAMVARNSNDFDKSISLNQKAADRTKEPNPSYIGSLGSTILESVTQNVFSFVTNQVDNDSKNKVKYAIELLTSAWDSFKNTDLKESHAWLLLNRGIGKKFISDYEGAYNDIREANEIAPLDFSFLRHLVIICFETKRYDQCFSNIDKLIELSSGSERGETLLLKADFLLNTGRAKEALPILNEVNDKFNNLERKFQRELEHCLVTAHLKNDDPQSAIDLLKKLREDSPNEIAHYIETSILYLSIGQEEQAKMFANEAYDKIDVGTPKEELHELSHICFRLSIFDKAAQLLEKITDTAVYSHLTKNLIKGYYHSGQTGKAIDLLKQIEGKYGLDRFMTELFCVLHESIGDVKTAIQACQKYLAVNPDDQIILIRLLFNYDRLEMKEAVAETLKGISKIDYTLPPEPLFRLSSLYFKFDHVEKALEIAYETRRANFNASNCHLIYFSLIGEFNLKQSDYERKIVAISCAVRIFYESGASTKSYIIEDRIDSLPERNEINLTNPLTGQLLGKKAGDSIVIDKNLLTPQKFTIQDIQSKYLFAFHESINLLGTRFIDQPGFQIFNTGKTGDLKEDFKYIFESLDESEKFDEQLNILYVRQQVTIGFYSKIKKTNPIRSISVIIQNPTLGIYPVWLANEFAVSKKLLDESIDLVLDLTSLIVLGSIGSLDIFLKRIPNKLIVAQASFDMIREQIQELKGMKSDGFMTVGKVNGKYVKEVVTSEQVKKHIDHFEGLLEWIKANCEIEPCLESLKMKQVDKERLDDLLGASFVDTILIAKSKKALLFSDESLLRQLAMNEHGVRGTHTFILLTYLLNKKLISTAESNDLLIKVFTMNLKGLAVDEQALAEAALRAKYSPVYPFSLLVTGLSSTLLNNKFATVVALNFLYRLYSDSGIQIYSSLPLNLIRQNLSMLVISELAKRDRFDFDNLIALIRLKFSLLQPQSDELGALIKTFRNQSLNALTLPR